MKKFLIIILLVLLYPQFSSAQNSYVKAGNSPDKKSITVKWFQEKNRFEEGVNIYRKDNTDNNWMKLTDKPIKKPAELSEADAKTSDQETAKYNFFINTSPSDQEEYENWEFTIILQSLLNTKFAEYAALGYTDNKIEPGRKYSYKVSYIKSGAEVELGITEEVSLEDAVPTVSNSLTLAQNKEKVFCNWNIDPDRIIAYNIYRDGTKLNKEPIFVFDMGSKPAYLFADSLGTEGTYNYSYTGLDAFNNESPASASVSISFESPNMPPRPVNVSFDGNSKLTIFWRVNSTANFKGFNIFRAEDVKGQFTKINSSLIPSTDTSYIDNSAELNKKYFYYVSSEGSPGFVNNSSVIAASAADYSKPATPENFSAVGDSINVHLSWSPVASSNVIGYKVYRNIRGNESEFLLLTPLPLKETSFTDTLSKGALNDFYYKVVSVNQKYMNSDYSAPVSVKLKDVVPPSAPFISNISGENNSVTITWQPLFEMDLAGYKIYRSEDTLSGFTEISSVTKEKISFTDNTAATGKIYYYKISAADASGNISEPSEISAISFVSDAPQIIPVKINAVYNKNNNSIDISWENAPAANSPVKGYIVIRKDNEEEFAYPVSDILNSLSFSDTLIETPGKYSYSVKIIYENDEVITTSEQLIETN